MLPKLDELKESLGQFEYGLYGILEQDITIKINPLTRQVLLGNIYRHDKNPRRGICSELVNTAYDKLTEKYPDTYFFRVEGYEPRFFKSPDTHGFIIACDDELIVQKLRRGKINHPRELDTSKLTVIDPSFNLIIPFEGSGYEPVDIFLENNFMDFTNGKILKHATGIPILPYGKGLLHLYAFFGLPEVLCFGMDLPGKQRVHFSDGIYGKTMDCFIDGLREINEYEADQMGSLVEKLRSVKPEISVWPLKDKSKIISR